MTNILEMLGNSLGNGYLHLRDSQRLHQRGSVVVGAVGSTKTWHRDTDDSLAVQSKLVEGAHADQQGQR